MGEIFDMIARAHTQARALPQVYPGYIASRIKRWLVNSDPERICTEAEAHHIGDCRHEVIATDFNGTKYRITVEVMNEQVSG